MTEPNTNIDTENVPSRSIPERITVPMLLFSGSLCLMLFLSWAFLLPRFTSVNVEGEIMTPHAVSKRVKELNAQLVTMEEMRIRLVLPLHDATYEVLKSQKLARHSAADVESILKQAAARTEEAQAIVIESMELDAKTGAVHVTGDVRGVGPRSMTILASFMEELGTTPLIADLTRPTFTRTTDEKGEIHSPFEISFTLTK